MGLIHVQLNEQRQSYQNAQHDQRYTHVAVLSVQVVAVQQVDLEPVHKVVDLKQVEILAHHVHEDDAHNNVDVQTKPLPLPTDLVS
jgi:hypothetical protein